MYNFIEKKIVKISTQVYTYIYIYIYIYAKGLVTKLAPPHTQSAWGYRGERVRTVRLAACCYYFSKKKKKVYIYLPLPPTSKLVSVPV